MLSAFSTPLFFNGTKTERVKKCDPLSIMCTHISVSADVKSVISCFQGRVDLQRVPCFFKPCLFKNETLRRKKQASLRLVNGASIKNCTNTTMFQRNLFPSHTFRRYVQSSSPRRVNAAYTSNQDRAPCRAPGMLR